MLFFCLLATILNCKKEKKEVSIDSFMVGKWEASFVRIHFPTHKASDSTHIIKEVFNEKSTRVPQSEYFKNGTFNSWFLDKEGKQQDFTSGKWSIKNDTLFATYFYLGKEISPKYRVNNAKKAIKISSIYDWDNDGKNDDTFYMVAKSID